jgi:hypothetical protein
MQNTRLSELEKLLAKTSAQPSPRIKSAEMTSSEEINNLKQENRVVSAIVCHLCISFRSDSDL